MTKKCEFCLRSISFHTRRVLHALSLRHGTDGFTSPPKKVVLQLLIALKIHRPRLGLNPRTLGPVLPLDTEGDRLMLVTVQLIIFCLPLCFNETKQRYILEGSVMFSIVFFLRFLMVLSVTVDTKGLYQFS
jgi:hypothetical protein